MRLRVLQFNVLAPSARICKPLDGIPWQVRHAEICQVILGLGPDVICLQEFCFVTPGFADLYLQLLGSIYHCYQKKRTGYKPEGLAILVRKAAFDDVQIETVDLEPSFCDRVAMFVTMSHRDSGQRMLVCTTHLTVAHASNSHDIPSCRPMQCQQVLERLSAVVIIATSLPAATLTPSLTPALTLTPTL